MSATHSSLPTDLKGKGKAVIAVHCATKSPKTVLNFLLLSPQSANVLYFFRALLPLQLLLSYLWRHQLPQPVEKAVTKAVASWTAKRHLKDWLIF